MDKVKEWGITEFQKLVIGGVCERDELAVMFDNIVD